MSAKVKQHWIPQFYLRYFAIPGFKNKGSARIWQLDVETHSLSTPKIRDVCEVEYLYSHIQKDGSRCFRIEDKLGDLENLIARMYPRVAEGFPDLEKDWGIKKLMALFLATIWLRHPEMQAKTTETHCRMVEFFESAPKDGSGMPAITHAIVEGKRIEIDDSGYDEWKSADQNELKVFFAEQIEFNAGRIAEVLIKKRWVFLCASDPVFLTSDKPLALTHPEKKTFGLGTADALLMFPISPRRVLWMTDREDGEGDGFYPFPSKEASHYNLVTIMNATALLLGQKPPDEHIREVEAWMEKISKG